MAKRNIFKVWETIYVVEGIGELPLDMLRYESAFPRTERDAHIAGEVHRGELRRVVLASRRVNDNGPSVERWRSFAWTVVGTFVETLDAEECRDKVAPARGTASV